MLSLIAVTFQRPEPQSGSSCIPTRSAHRYTQVCPE